MWKPETSSVSASGRSNGARLVSATAAIRKMTKASGWERMYQLLISKGPISSVSLLGDDDVAQAERAGQDEDADQGEPEDDLVGDDLRGRAEPAEQRVAVGRGVGAEDDAVDADRAEGEDEEGADVEVGDEEVDVAAEDLDRAAEGDHGDARRWR